MLKSIADVLRSDARRDTQESANMPDGRVRPVLRIINGALDEDNDGRIILNGRIDPATLRFLKVDSSYQRPLAERPDIFEAIKTGVVVPNIEVGVRGQTFETAGADFLIYDPAYTIDGQQRVGNALRLLELVPNHPVRMFATVHFGTDVKWETNRFTELNSNSKKVSASHHLRNLRIENEAITTLYGLSNNQRDFPLYKKVCWTQNMRRGELIAAYLFTRVATKLHGHLHGSASHSSAASLAAAALRQAHEITLPKFRQNVTTFFEAVDEAWGIHNIEYRFSAVQLRSGFLLQLARLLSAHVDFWDASGRTLFVPVDVRRRLGKFAIADPTVKNLAGAGTGGSSNILYDLMVSHLNKGKQADNYLHSRFA